MRRLVIIDDDPGMRMLLRMAADTDGWQVEDGPSSASVRRAIPLADAVTLDLHLDDEHGIDVLRAIRAAGSAVPVVVLSGDDDPQVTMDCFEAGATEILYKPFEVAQLFDVLRRLTTAPRAAVDLTDRAAEPVEVDDRPWFMTK